MRTIEQYKAIFERREKTQRQQILDYLRKGNSITPLEALDIFGCFRLGARIWELRQAGEKITREMITENGKTFAQYRLGA